MHIVRDFPHVKLDSEINARFLLNERGDCMNLNYTRLHTIDLDFKKSLKFCQKIFSFNAVKKTSSGSAVYVCTKRILKFVI